MTHLERMQACLAGGQVDRPPVALWRHFPVDDQYPERLAASTLAFQRLYDFDFIKVTPASSFCIKDYGVQDEWQGNPEGVRTYTQRAIQRPEDWERLPVLDPGQGSLARQITCLFLINKDLTQETPVIQTIFSPLAQAKNLIGKDELVVHLRKYPDAVHTGLGKITESTLRFFEAARKTGIAGIFYAVQQAQYGILTVDEFQSFGSYYDLQILDACRDLWLNVLHLHGENVMFDQLANYPVTVMNWHDRDTYPSLAEAQQRFNGAVCGGLRSETIVYGAPEEISDQARDAVRMTGGKKFILGTGCVTPVIAPWGNIQAARQSVAMERQP